MKHTTFRAPAAQDVFLNLAGGSLRQLRDEREALWNFEMGEAVASELTHLRRGRGSAGPEDDEGMRGFTPFFVRQSDDGNFLHRRVPQQRALDFN